MRIMHMLVIAALTGCTPAPQAASPAAQPDDTETRAAQARIAALPSPYNEASYASGRRVFLLCRTCHTIEAGAPHRVGPNLNGVVGRRAGGAADFDYSDALASADFTWNAERLDRWLADPQTYLPGNRMAFAGVRDPAQRRDLIAYLMLHSEPAP